MVKFSCKATGGFEMLERHAEQVLRVVGKELTERGIITVEQVPGAIAALRALGAQDRAADARARAAKDDEDDEAVSLSRRAFPLLDMLERAQAAGEPVLWGV